MDKGSEYGAIAPIGAKDVVGARERIRMAFRPVRGRVAQRATILVAPHEDRVSGRCVG